MKHLHLTLLTLALAGLATSSQAGSVTVQFDDPIFNGTPAGSSDAVTITYPKQSGGGLESAGARAGRFQGTVKSYSADVDPGIFVDGLDDLFMYCYDVYDHIGGGWTVDYTINLNGERDRTLDFLGAVNEVLNKGKSRFDPFAWLHPNNGAVAAAIQLGIWESKYENTDTWNIDSGGFRATGLANPTEHALQGFFDAIDTSASLEAKYVMTLEARGAQDMITGDPPPPPGTVPEPGTLALLGAAGAGLFATRRRSGPRPEAA